MTIYATINDMNLNSRSPREICARPVAHPEVCDFGFAMVRPDALDMHLEEAIIDRIEANAELKVIKRKILKLDGNHVDNIYSDLVDRSFYPGFRESLVGKHVMSLLIGGNQDVSDELMNIKGTVWGPPGSVRSDFSLAHLLTGDELAMFHAGKLGENHLAPDVATDIMRYDRMHCEEDAHGTRKAVRTVFTEAEIEETSTLYSELPQFLDRC